MDQYKDKNGVIHDVVPILPNGRVVSSDRAGEWSYHDCHGAEFKFLAVRSPAITNGYLTRQKNKTDFYIHVGNLEFDRCFVWFDSDEPVEPVACSTDFRHYWSEISQVCITAYQITADCVIGKIGQGQGNNELYFVRPHFDISRRLEVYYADTPEAGFWLVITPGACVMPDFVFQSEGFTPASIDVDQTTENLRNELAALTLSNDRLAQSNASLRKQLATEIKGPLRQSKQQKDDVRVSGRIVAIDSTSVRKG